MYRNILVPADGSDTSKLGLLEAMKLAQAGHGFPRLLHVVNTAVIALESAATFAASDDLPAKLRDDGQYAEGRHSAVGIVTYRQRMRPSRCCGPQIAHALCCRGI